MNFINFFLKHNMEVWGRKNLSQVVPESYRLRNLVYVEYMLVKSIWSKSLCGGDSSIAFEVTVGCSSIMPFWHSLFLEVFLDILTGNPLTFTMFHSGCHFGHQGRNTQMLHLFQLQTLNLGDGSKRISYVCGGRGNSCH